MNPINYVIDVKNPFENALQGVNAGLALSNAIDLSQQRQIEQQKNKMILDRTKAYQEGMNELANDPQLTVSKLNRFAMQFPEMSTHINEITKNLGEEQKTSLQTAGNSIFSSLLQGQNDIAANTALKYSEALKSKGQTEQSQAFAQLAQGIKDNPKGALVGMAPIVQSYSGGKFEELYNPLLKGGAELGRIQAETAEKTAAAAKTTALIPVEVAEKQATGLKAQEEATDLATTRQANIDKLKEETAKIRAEAVAAGAPKMTPVSEKLINDSIESATKAGSTAEQMRSLATRLENDKEFMKSAGGKIANFQAWLRDALGGKTQYDFNRSEIDRLFTPQWINMLPPGAASEKEGAAAKATLLSSNAEPTAVIKALRVYSTLQDYDQRMNNAKAKWAATNGHIGPASKDLTIDGIQVSKGNSFNDFAKKFIQIQPLETRNVQNRPYVQYLK